MRIVCGTWNIQGADPGYVSRADIKRWLYDSPRANSSRNPNRNDIPRCDPDIYAIGLQEVIPMDKNVKVPKIIIAGANNFDLSRIDIRDKVIYAWSNRLLQTINSLPVSSRYSLYGAFLLNGTALFIIAKNTILAQRLLTNGKTDAVRADDDASELEIFLLPDNRSPGAVAMRFDCGGSSFAFVCAHLSSGDGINACAKRNADYRKIANELFRNQGYTLNGHEYVFWFGDLNYRICPPAFGVFTPRNVWKLARRKELIKLLEADELVTQRKAGLAFQGYQEGLPDFDPTYPYIPATVFNKPKPGVNTRNTGPNYEEFPAWTDRILWRRLGNATSQDFHGKLEAYALADVRVSDHRPVVAVIDVEVPDRRFMCPFGKTPMPQRQPAMVTQSLPQYQPMVAINNRPVSPGPLQNIMTEQSQPQQEPTVVYTVQKATQAPVVQPQQLQPVQPVQPVQLVQQPQQPQVAQLVQQPQYQPPQQQQQQQQPQVVQLVQQPQYQPPQQQQQQQQQQLQYQLPQQQQQQQLQLQQPQQQGVYILA